MPKVVTISGLIWLLAVQSSNAIETAYSYLFRSGSSGFPTVADSMGEQVTAMPDLIVTVPNIDGSASIEAHAVEEADGSLRAGASWQYSINDPATTGQVNIRSRATSTMDANGTIVGPEASQATHLVAFWTITGGQELDYQGGAFFDDYSALAYLEAGGLVYDLPTLAHPGPFFYNPSQPPDTQTILEDVTTVWEVTGVGPHSVSANLTVIANGDFVNDPYIAFEISTTASSNVDLTNTATLTGVEVFGGTVESPIEIDAFFDCDICQPLAIEKTASPASYSMLGQAIDYDYIVKNTGVETIYGPITVLDDKVATVVCTPVVELTPGASVSCSAEYFITQEDLDVGSLTNIATASGFDSQGMPVDSFRAVATVSALESVNVDIDIKPGSDPNTINLGSNGNVPVAIFSDATFDATTIDPTSVTLEDAQVRMKGNGTAQASSDDINLDGLLDLVVHVETSGLDLTVGDVVAQLNGVTYGGRAITGSDMVRVIDPPTVPVPEPASACLLAVGFLGLLLRTRSRR